MSETFGSSGRAILHRNRMHFAALDEELPSVAHGVIKSETDREQNHVMTMLMYCSFVMIVS